jgi:hypothetical protein
MIEPPVRPVRYLRIALAYLLWSLVVAASFFAAYYLAKAAPESLLRRGSSQETLGLAVVLLVLAPLYLLWMKIVSHLLSPDELDRLLRNTRRRTMR